MPLFLGIDGGQSSTTALIADQHGNVLGHARGGPCNHVTSAEAAEQFLCVIRTCLEAACLMAGIELTSTVFAAACCGMSGGPADKFRLLQTLISTSYLRVTDDGVIALSGALHGEPGVAVIGGTGSIAYGRGPNGISARAGGWGYIYGDEGGAFDIARQAVQAVLRWHEGWGPATALAERFLRATEAENANDMMHGFYRTDWARPRVAALSALVDEAAISGDSVARAILDNAAQQLCFLALAVRAQLFQGGTPFQVAPIGGVFRSEILSARFKMLVELTDGGSCVIPRMPPVAGAVLEAYRSAGVLATLRGVPELK